MNQNLFHTPWCLLLKAIPWYITEAYKWNLIYKTGAAMEKLSANKSFSLLLFWNWPSRGGKTKSNLKKKMNNKKKYNENFLTTRESFRVCVLLPCNIHWYPPSYTQWIQIKMIFFLCSSFKNNLQCYSWETKRFCNTKIIIRFREIFCLFFHTFLYRKVFSLNRSKKKSYFPTPIEIILAMNLRKMK